MKMMMMSRLCSHSDYPPAELVHLMTASPVTGHWALHLAQVMGSLEVGGKRTTRQLCGQYGDSSGNMVVTQWAVRDMCGLG